MKTKKTVEDQKRDIHNAIIRAVVKGNNLDQEWMDDLLVRLSGQAGRG